MESALADRLDTAPCGFLTFGEDGRIEHANRTLLELLGFEHTELLGRHVETIFSVGTRIFYQTHWFPLLRLHGRAEEIFLMLRTRAGEEIGMLSNAVRHERAGRAGFDCVLMRVRQRQEYEGELLRARRTAEEASRAKSAFLAVMSHELRTPLNAISGYVELLDMGIHGPITDAQRGALDRIRRSQLHLLRLINDILNLARIEAGRIDYLIEPVNLAGLVAEVRPLVEPQAEERRLQLETTVPRGLFALADHEKLQQILLNLLGNAIKFTPEQGRIEIAASEADGDRVALVVSDTGIGIPTAKLQKIFEPFVQVDVSHARRKEGTGLGLAISRDLARGMGGELSAQSTEGEGSAFTLVLPRARQARALVRA